MQKKDEEALLGAIRERIEKAVEGAVTYNKDGRDYMFIGKIAVSFKLQAKGELTAFYKSTVRVKNVTISGEGLAL